MTKPATAESPPARTSWKVKLAAGITLALLSGLLLEGAAYLAWRFTLDERARLFEPHADFGYFHIPGRQIDYRFREAAGEAASDHPIRINDKGLRDRERSYDKPDGVHRTLVLGDSMVFAHQVPREARFTDLLEAALAERGGATRYEVLNAGVDGYGTANQLLFFRHEGFRYHPDVVVLTFCMSNDVLDNHRTLARRTSYRYITEPYFVLRDGELSLRNHPAPSSLLTRSYAYRHFAKTVGTWAPGLVEEVNRIGLWEDFPLYGRFMQDGIPLHMHLYLEETDPEWQEAWELTWALIAALGDEAAGHSARFLVLVVPASLQLDREEYWRWTREAFPGLQSARLDPGKPSRLLREGLQRDGVPFLDLLPVFTAYEAETGEAVFFDVDIHLRERGHRVVARALEAELDSRGYLEPHGS